MLAGARITVLAQRHSTVLTRSLDSSQYLWKLQKKYQHVDSRVARISVLACSEQLSNLVESRAAPVQKKVKFKVVGFESPPVDFVIKREELESSSQSKIFRNRYQDSPKECLKLRSIIWAFLARFENQPENVVFRHNIGCGHRVKIRLKSLDFCLQKPEEIFTNCRKTRSS